MDASVVSSARMGSPRTAFRGWWAEARGYQRLAYLVGAGLILVGLAHAGAWAVAGGPAAGALSWRKPTTFGISLGLTTVTLAWVATWLPVRKAVGWTAAGLLAAPAVVAVAAVAAVTARRRHPPAPKDEPDAAASDGPRGVGGPAPPGTAG
jgi:hypothetical protein